ncbi:MAG: succinylglutamate desuccinylase/aspartoacylase family protein [Oligoflexia bacterium]|nr:succinylglutamate desuccinylase/aspartoacylase family protein [Oligoflexia bacterium]
MVEIKKVPVRTLASGDSLHITVYDFKGSQKNAPKVYIQSATHGSEVQGSLVIAKLFEFLKENPPLGDVRLVPNANPMGLNQKAGDYTFGRFDLTNGDNYNRRYFLPVENMNWEQLKGLTEATLYSTFKEEMMKKLLEKKNSSISFPDALALTLQTLSIDSDLCLDLHCANRSAHHIYVPEYAKEDAAYFSIPFQIIMPKDKFGGAMDEVFFRPWTMLAEQLNLSQIKTQSFTIELGNHESISSSQAESDLAGILNYLRHKKVIQGEAEKKNPVNCPINQYMTIYSAVGGLVDYVAQPGKRVKKGDLLARILRFSDEPDFFEVKSPYDGIPIVFYSSSIAHEGIELMRILSDV